jgi:hypothetical protein
LLNQTTELTDTIATTIRLVAASTDVTTLLADLLLFGVDQRTESW